jgi:small subunit ribosomal protein S17e
MGRIKTTLIKRIGRDIYDAHAGEFTEDYSENKKILSNFIDIKSKKLKNIVAGYVTNLKRQKAS